MEKKQIEPRRYGPLSSDRAPHGGFRRRALCVLTLLALAEVRSAHAACVPGGTMTGDTLVCSGSQTDGVAAKAGNDSISILPGASISLTAPQSTTAVDAGPGNDSVVNDGGVSVTVNPPAQVPANALAGESATCSSSHGDSYAKSGVQAIAIAGGGGNDLINNRGTITVQSAAASGTGSQCDPSHSDNRRDDDDDGHRPVRPAAVGIGILGDNGSDQINNSGSMAVSASSDANSPQVTAKGIVGANGDDVIVNTGTITVAASSTAAASTPPDAPAMPSSSRPYEPSGNRSHDHRSRRQDISETGSVTAVGIEGGNGKDVLHNDNVLTVNASATVSGGITPSFSLDGGDEVTATTTLETRAVGISGGAGKDEISNSGTLTVDATSEVSGVSVDVNLIDLSHSDTSTFVRSSATGIDAGSGKDDISLANTGTIAANATSKSSGVSVEVDFVEAATGDSKLEVQSTATGIVGGQGKNTIDTSGAVKATATSQTGDVSATVTYADVSIADSQISNTSTTVESRATGIDGSKGENRINIAANGSVEAAATSTLNSLLVSVSMEGVSQSVQTLIDTGSVVSTGIASNSTATGVAGSSQGDYLTNAGSVTSDAKSSATQNSIGIGFTAVELTIPTPSISLVGAGTAANAAAIGIDGGGGGDTILNSGVVKSDANASATAGAFSINIGVFALNIPGAPSGLPVSAALVVADTATTASARSTGIAGGAGDDVIRNAETGTVQTQADADAVSLAVSASAKIEFEKGEQLFAAGAVAARAGTEATSQAVGIDAGAGANRIYNDGDVTAGAKSHATAVGVAVNVAGSFQGSGAILGLAATDTSSIATAGATGIRGGGDRDRISNTGSVAATSSADVTAVSASVEVAIAKDAGFAAGASLARAESIATAGAMGIDGAGGNDEIENTGTVDAKATANAAAVGVSVAVTGTKHGVAGSAALTDAGTTATATAIGIRSGGTVKDDDKDGHHEHDDKDRDRHDKHDDKDGDGYYKPHDKNAPITNASAGVINVEAQANTLSVGVSADLSIAKEGAVLGAALADTSTRAEAVGKGIEADSGDNEINNEGTITVKSGASGQAVSVALTNDGTAKGLAAGAALARSDNIALATATGLDGGSGNDELVNQAHGSITLQGVKADADAVSVSLAIAAAQDGLALSAALVDADAAATATAIGMAGGAGNDKLSNLGAIAANDVKADATAVGVSVSATFSQNGAVVAAALAETGTTANATAKGLDGGAGDDRLYNEGSVTLQEVSADAGAVSVVVDAAGAQNGVTIAAGLADASGKAFSTATGLDGGTGDDSLVNNSKGKINLEDIGASASAAGISVALSGSSVGLSAGAALADTSGSATSTAKGLDGGAGNDTLVNDGEIALNRTTADADSTSVSVEISASLTGVAAGAALTRAGASSNATAVGMDGGAGNDQILNLKYGSITLDGVTANANATGVSVELGVTNAGLAIGAALADTRSAATSTAKGLEGGEGDDGLKNEGQITLQNVKADAQAVSVSASVNGAITGGVAAGIALTDGRGTAEVTAIGMDGGAGRDTLYNSGNIHVQDVEAKAHAAGVSVSVNVSMAGVAAGAALADTSATARSAVKGMDGGAGDDRIANTGGIDVRGKSTADALSIAISVNAAAGIAVGGEITDASTTAETTATGIDAGTGRNEIANSGSIGATAEAEAKAASISVGVSLGVGGDATLADARSGATATALGINDAAEGASESANAIVNAGAVTATATSKSQGVSIAGNLRGLALGETTNTSTAEAIGIRTSEGKDQIQNEKAITAASNATATGLAVSVTLAGAAMGDSSTTAQAIATGIQAGGGDDEIYINSLAAINASARSSAGATTVSVDLVGVSEANASTKSLATATGIDGGGGKDRIVNHASVTASTGDAAAAASADCTTAGGACANTSAVSVTLGGTGAVDATTSARSTATGIAGDADDDSIYSDGAIDASARAKTAANGVSIGIFGTTQSSLDTTATASATGLSGGDGYDVIETLSTIKAASASHIAISATGFTLGGSGGVEATLSATALATAIDGGAGKDKIHNEAALTVSATSTLSSSGDSTVVFGSSGTGATSGAFTDAAGIRAGAGDDQVWNSGAFDVRSTASLSLSSSSFTFGGTGGTDGSLTASTQSTGIAGGTGRDSITNVGDLSVSASSSLVSSGGASVAFGSTGASANSGAVTNAVGIDGGDDDDVILNKGRVTAGSSASLSMDNSSFSFGGTGGTSGSLTASTQSTGIAGGKGRDSIMNEGELNVGASSSLDSSGGSSVAFGSSGAGSNSGAVTNAAGIDGGDDDDVIHNKGRVTATSSASLSMDSSSFTFGGSDGTSGSLTASTQSTGIAGGKGRDSLMNEGELNASASSSLASSGGSSVAFGSSGAGSDSGAVTSAVGIDGGDGDDYIRNKGRVTASSDAALHMDSSSFSFAGGGGVSGTLTATTRSVGLQGGDGGDAIQNEGDVVVSAQSDLQNNGSVSTSLGGSADASGEAASTLSARGIDGGAGDNWIANNGTIDVKAAANTVSTLSSSSGFFAGQSTTIGNSRADVTAAGIDVGQGNNTVLNAKSIAVELSGTVSTQASSDGSSLGADATSISRSVLAATAVGIAAGDGANQITNTSTGSIDVKTWRPVDLFDIVLEAPVQATAGGHGEGHLGGDATVFISAETSVFAAGISAGNGANTIRNEGSIDVDLRALATAVGSTDPGSTGGDGESHADTAIFARAAGIAAGDGANQITNTGSVKVMTELATRSDTFAIGHTTGDADALSIAKTNVFAAGIDVGNGANMIRNEGALDVSLGAAARTSTDTDAGTTGSNFDFSDARVAAQGYGIHTGSGNNTVVNKGTINVTVTGTASTNFGSGTSVTAWATGIATGAGNDTITNEGTITATTIINGVTSSGTAINAGAGDDLVKLTDGSVTNGTIDLGTGSNRLELEGTPVINGSILDGTSSLALVFNAAGSFAGGLPGVSAVKNGPGTFTLSMLNKMQRIEVNQGTLKLDSDYTFMGNGTFQAKVNGDGSCGQFYVNGRAGLDGAMKIVRGRGAYVDGTSFDVLIASNGVELGTAFSHVDLPEDTRLLKFHAEQLPDGVRVKADVASFTTVAGTPNQMAVARNLDRILPRTTGDLNQLLGDIQVLPEGQFASAFASMSPAVYAGYSASTFNGVQQYTNVLQDRMTALRASDFSPAQTAGAPSEPIRLASAGKGLSDLLEWREAERARSSGLWLRGFSQKGDQNATEDMNGYDYRLTGTTVGYDRRFTNSLSAGASLGTVRNKVNVDSNVSQGDLDSTMASVYAGYFDRKLYLNGVLSAGRNKYDTRRTLFDQSTATSSHDGDVLAATLGAGHYVQLAAWWLEPFATVQYTRLKEEGFSETGSTGNLIVEGRSASGWVSTVGARFSRPIQDGNGASWIPQASLAWLHDYSRHQVINASYVDAPDSSFSIEGQPIQRNGALLGLGVSYRTKGGLTSTFQYTGEFRDRFRAHGLAGEFRFEF